MGIFNGMLGNASEVNIEDVTREYGNILATNERVEKAYKLIRDMFIFTDKRLVLVDKQGLTGKKTEYHSIPYKNITHFSIETAGSFDLDAELKIWISGSSTPLQKQFNKNLNIYELQKVLADYVLK
ncbi:cytoplasmic protein [Lottiidibacillus patelloidae]|uniref:Cytoplasmic protein n=1 Tax=Lottiidibacillus patelloidae TaxID=2670334 RepID=A0A263BS26_9BACI|nr:PH domain-containing protein [Lottiidibacillus patelloidae]OZM56167.1 cytoplasmic protein [Lottiidibacillus patelloidae]